MSRSWRSTHGHNSCVRSFAWRPISRASVVKKSLFCVVFNVETDRWHQSINLTPCSLRGRLALVWNSVSEANRPARLAQWNNVGVESPSRFVTRAATYGTAGLSDTMKEWAHSSERVLTCGMEAQACWLVQANEYTFNT